MPQGRVAPATGIIRQSIVGRAEVGGSDDNGPRQTPLLVIHTSDLKTSTTPLPVVKQSSAQGSSDGSVSLTVKVPISTSPSCHRTQVIRFYTTNTSPAFIHLHKA
uniref:Uncharacterized protein n=1 Tax=Kalanchoe fedtschenkoi TaxID=63787 RepID=A0A7N0TJ65_KALFE